MSCEGVIAKVCFLRDSGKLAVLSARNLEGATRNECEDCSLNFFSFLGIESRKGRYEIYQDTEVGKFP